MAQWMNIHWNNSFVNPTWLPLCYKSSKAINLVQLDLTAGWHAGEMQVNFEFYKIHNTVNQEIFM